MGQNPRIAGQLQTWDVNRFQIADEKRFSPILVVVPNTICVVLQSKLSNAAAKHISVAQI